MNIRLSLFHVILVKITSTNEIKSIFSFQYQNKYKEIEQQLELMQPKNNRSNDQSTHRRQRKGSECSITLRFAGSGNGAEAEAEAEARESIDEAMWGSKSTRADPSNQQKFRALDSDSGRDLRGSKPRRRSASCWSVSDNSMFEGQIN